MFGGLSYAKHIVGKLFYTLQNAYTYNSFSYNKIVSYVEKNTKNNKVAFVFGSPFHSNMGDQAQTYCTEIWLNKNYPDYIALAINGRYLQQEDDKLLKIIRRLIKKEDMVFLHSGYHTTDLYMKEEILQRKVIQMFADRRVVILPQTVNYVELANEEESRRIYNAHPNLHMITRDSVSYQKALSIFPNVHVSLYPDIVTTLIGTREYSTQRNGILLCLRNDKESAFNSERIGELIGKLNQLAERVDITDTTIKKNPLYVTKNRADVLDKMWRKFSKYKLVITDRYHGTIFSLIANTPVIILPSTDHKLSSIVNWFPESYKDYVSYCSDNDLVIDEAKRILEKKLDYKIPEYFNLEYYNKLKEQIEER